MIWDTEQEHSHDTTNTVFENDTEHLSDKKYVFRLAYNEIHVSVNKAFSHLSPYIYQIKDY